MRAVILIFLMAVAIVLAEDAYACSPIPPNVVNLDTPNISPVYVQHLYDLGYYASPYDNCECLYSPNVAWDE